MNIKLYIQQLSKTSLFKSIDQEDLLSFFDENLYKITRYKKGNIVYFQNEICSTMDILLEGNLTIQNIDEEGNVLTVADFSPYNTIGENLIFSNRNTYPMNVISKTDITLLKMKKELILTLCHHNEQFLLMLLNSISNKTVVLSDKISLISTKSIRQLIIDFLNTEYIYQDSKVITLSCSKKELAEKFGIRRPSLSRELKKMRDQDLIEFDARTITIKSKEIISS